MPGNKKKPDVVPLKLPLESPTMTRKKKACPTSINICNTRGCSGTTVDRDMYCSDCNKKMTQKGKK